MGLFINKEKHPAVYKNREIKNENNQEFHRKDYLEELLQIQRTTNLSLCQSLDELKLHNHKQKELHSVQWKNLNNQLKDMKNREFEQHDLDIQIIEQLKILEEKYKTIHSLMEKETKLNLEILTRLENQEKLNQQLSDQIEEQTKLEKNMTEKMAQQESYQTEILTRIDKQEALTEKLARQINHIRSILFERTNFLAEKIEDGYKLTSSYVYKLLTGSEQPITFYTLKNKQEEHQKQSE
jgi:hypothetical protein